MTKVQRKQRVAAHKRRPPQDRARAGLGAPFRRAAISSPASVKLRVLDIARAARSKAKQSQEKLKRAYGQLLNSTSRVVGQAKRFSTEIATGVKRSSDVLQQLALESLRGEIDERKARDAAMARNSPASWPGLPEGWRRADRDQRRAGAALGRSAGMRSRRP
jgi:hypothetical protein